MFKCFRLQRMDILATADSNRNLEFCEPWSIGILVRRLRESHQWFSPSRVILKPASDVSKLRTYIELPGRPHFLDPF